MAGPSVPLIRGPPHPRVPREDSRWRQRVVSLYCPLVQSSAHSRSRTLSGRVTHGFEVTCAGSSGVIHRGFGSREVIAGSVASGVRFAGGEPRRARALADAAGARRGTASCCRRCRLARRGARGARHPAALHAPGAGDRGAARGARHGGGDRHRERQEPVLPPAGARDGCSRSRARPRSTCFPTKALAQDQLKSLTRLAPAGISR